MSTSLTAFDYNPSSRVVFAENALEQLGSHASALAGPRVLLVTDPGLVEAGIAARAQRSLESAALACVVFSQVRENPTTAEVDAGVAHARAHGPFDLIIGLGGGSAMDCAKGINFLLSNGGQMQDYWGVGKAKKDMLPSIGVPTTAGTGSEAQSFALIAKADTHEKMACGDRKARFGTVLLDPLLIMSVPATVRAASGIDALSHAVESYVSNKRNALAQLFAREAFRLLVRNFALHLENPSDLDAAAAMQLGAHLAGMAIENSMLGSAHACANPLTARYDTTHGHAVALMLPHVVRHNGETMGALYDELSAGAGIAEGAEGLARAVEALREKALLPETLAAVGVDKNELPLLAAEASKQWTGTFNPRPMSEEDFLRLYERAY